MLLLELIALKELNKPVEIPQPKPEVTTQVVPQEKKPKPKNLNIRYYNVKIGDTLTSISKAHRVPLKRVWAANTQLSHPDKIKAGETLKIPHPSQKLKERAMISVVPVTDRKPSQAGGFSSSNTYQPGQCTWHVKNLASWVPNSWGDASNWGYNARADGYTVSSTARVGAVAWRSGHVAYVVGVGIGTVTVSEMNYNWVPFSKRTITIPASRYQYIY